MEAAIGQTPGPIDHPCAARILAWGSIPSYSNWNSRAGSRFAPIRARTPHGGRTLALALRNCVVHAAVTVRRLFPPHPTRPARALQRPRRQLRRHRPVLIPLAEELDSQGTPAG